MASYTRQVKEILRRHKCKYDRAGKGDHEVWFSPINNHKLAVDHNIKSRDLANVILKQAG